MRTVWLVALVSALLLAGAACGGGDEEAAEETVTFTETMDDATTDEDTTDTSDLDDDAFDFASDECQQLVAAYVAIAQSLASAAGGASDITEQAEIFARFADRVPDEIRADIRALADAYTQYADVLEDTGLEPGEIPSAEQAQELQQALQSVGTADVAAAGERVSAWTQQNC